MNKANRISTLLVGIDISSGENAMAIIDFKSTKPIVAFIFPNNKLGAEEMDTRISAYLTLESGLNLMVIALESTSFYEVHIANYMSNMLTLFDVSTTQGSS